MIQRLPHPIFSAFWVLRYVAIVVSIVAGNVWALLASVVSFVPAEGLALKLKTKWRDQLSEIWTWALRTLPGDESTILGWNLLAPIFAALEMGAFHVLLAHTGQVPEVYIYFMTVPGWALLSLHWWRPQGIGSWWPKT